MTAIQTGMFTEFMEQRGPGHTCGGEQNFKVGYLEYKEKIKKTMDALDFMNDPEATDKMEELKAMDIACDAVIILGERYHKLALEMAEKEADPTRKKELEADRRPTWKLFRLTNHADLLAGNPVILVQHIWQLQQN
mgnify:CR=1 FL=1